eukprot:1153408-Pelagomonas_calceolata.AAC.7
MRCPCTPARRHPPFRRCCTFLQTGASTGEFLFCGAQGAPSMGVAQEGRIALGGKLLVPGKAE